MKVLFVTKPSPVAPLGIMYLSAALKAAGHETEAISTTSCYAAGLAWYADYVCYSVMTGDQDFYKDFDKWIRERGYDRHTTIYGGPHVTFFPQDFKGEWYIRGECEYALPTFVDHKDVVDAIHYVDNLDDLPFPDRDIIPEGKIKHFMASRGCPNKCAYCYADGWYKLHGQKRVRIRSISNVIEELSQVKPEFAYFQDDIFGLNIAWLEVFADEYAAKIAAPFHCHTRTEIVTPRYVAALKKAGCVSVHLALETNNYNLLRILGRDLVDTKAACKRLQEAGIKVMLQNIIGIPTGSIYDDLDTLKANLEIDPDYSWVSIYQPYPGTVLGDECIKNGWCKPSDIGPSFFNESVLSCFDDKYKGQLKVLQKVWASLVDGRYDPLLDEIYKNMREEGDQRLYGFKP